MKLATFLALILPFLVVSAQPPQVETHFSPKISPFIAAEIKAAHGRGVDVAVIVDKSYRTTAPQAVAALKAAGVVVLVDAAHAIAHNKVLVIDSMVTITGSFNFSNAADKSNAENIVIIRDAPTASSYLQNWEAHMRHANVAAAKR